MRPFILNFNSAQIAMTDLLQFLDSTPKVRNWQTPYSSVVLIVGDEGETALTLAESLRTRFPGAQFVISLVDRLTCDGWVTKGFWELVQNPKSSGRVEAYRAGLRGMSQ